MSYYFADKYDCVKTLYQSTATKVMLVRRKGCEELLVAKRTDKRRAVSADIFLEANLLQDLRHPGIPTLYETLVDDEYLYLIEEFVFGESLENYLLYHQHISQETFLKFAIQLCEIVEYLHTHKPDPILYLDMKPSHIIVCGNQIKIIDYGVANLLPNSGKNIQKYGTLKYAAPEQMSNENLNQQTDVYGVGKMLCLMLRYMKKTEAVTYLNIVMKTTKKNRKYRTKSITVVKSQLLHKQERKIKKTNDRKHLLYSIAVVGSDRGVGCTHIAIALVSYLNQAGFDAYYRNQTEQLVLEQIAKNVPVSESKDQIIYHEFFRGIRNIDARKSENPLGGIQVIDCGHGESNTTADATIYVCGGRLWQRAKPPIWETEREHIIICNFFSKYRAKRFSRETGRCVYVFPFLKNPFVITAGARIVFSQIMRKTSLKNILTMGKRK